MNEYTIEMPGKTPIIIRGDIHSFNDNGTLSIYVQNPDKKESNIWPLTAIIPNTALVLICKIPGP